MREQPRVEEAGGFVRQKRWDDSIEPANPLLSLTTPCYPLYYPLYCPLTALSLPLATPYHPLNRWDDGIELPARLYYSATARGPGLAVSRSLGDVLAHSAGLSHAAEVTKPNRSRPQPPPRPNPSPSASAPP